MIKSIINRFSKIEVGNLYRYADSDGEYIVLATKVDSEHTFYGVVVYSTTDEVSVGYMPEKIGFAASMFTQFQGEITLIA